MCQILECLPRLVAPLLCTDNTFFDKPAKRVINTPKVNLAFGLSWVTCIAAFDSSCCLEEPPSTLQLNSFLHIIPLSRIDNLPGNIIVEKPYCDPRTHLVDARIFLRQFELCPFQRSLDSTRPIDPFTQQRLVPGETTRESRAIAIV